jgi:hypothetical protein
MLRMSWVNSAETIEAFRSKGGRIVGVLTSKINLLMGQLSTFVQTQKLSGQVLAVRSGKLRASVAALPTRVSGTAVIGEVQQDPTIAFYGRANEFGVQHPWQIVASKQRFLKFISDGKVNFRRSVTHPPLPPRPFFGPSETENAAHIYEELKKSVADVIAEKE